MSDRQDKQFDPSARRLQKAREEGNVFKSREVVSVGLLVVGSGLIFFGLPYLFETLKSLMQQVFLSATGTSLTLASMPLLIRDLGFQVVLSMAPYFLVLMGAAYALNVAQSGFNVTTKPLKPKLQNISPASGLKRIFSKKGLGEFLKSFLKVAIVGPMAYLHIKGHMAEILMLHTKPMEQILQVFAGWLLALLVKMCLALLVLSAADFFFEKWRHKADLKMSHQEVKDESQESEGNPQVKAKRREKAMEIARRPRLDHAVLKADVVITNPTHYAIALRYNPAEDAAPFVLAKGIRKRALRIKGLALDNDIPTVENRPLARALYASVEEDQAIPPELYPAVAAVLAEVFRQRGSLPA